MSLSLIDEGLSAMDGTLSSATLLPPPARRPVEEGAPPHHEKVELAMMW